MCDAEIILKACEILEQGWCQFAGAKDKDGNKCAYDSTEAEKFCPVSALALAFDSVCGRGPDYQFQLKLVELAGKYFGRDFGFELILFNDNHTYEEVMALMWQAHSRALIEYANTTPENGTGRAEAYPGR